MQRNVIKALNEKAAALVESGRRGTASGYRNAADSLKRFKGSKLLFPDITPAFLVSYESWMVRQGLSITTVGFYTRNIRAIYNEAVLAKVVPKERYPFGINGYSCPAGVGNKRSKSAPEIALIMDFKCRTVSESRGRDFWLLSYLLNGMNPADLLQLKWRNVNLTSASFSFVREKSRRSSGDGVQVSGCLLDEAIEIINKWCARPGRGGDYVFPFLNHDMPEEDRDRAVDSFIRTASRSMSAVCEAIGIEPVSWQHARHSYAMAMINADVPLYHISRSMGHTSIKTTLSYVSSLVGDKVKGYAQALIPVKG